MNSFDELFNEFIGFPRQRPNLNKAIPDDLIDGLKKMIETLMRGPQEGFYSIIDDLGKPSNSEEYEDENGSIKKDTWEGDGILFTRITVRGDISSEKSGDLEFNPFNFIDKLKGKSLEQQLEEALEVEDYEEASRLRDEIKKRDEAVKENAKTVDELKADIQKAIEVGDFAKAENILKLLKNKQK